MLRSNRNYEHQDFSDLLNELHSASSDKNKNADKHQIENSPEKHQGKVVDIAHRRRFSKMDNRTMRYAYSVSKMVIHDRGCKAVNSIPDDEFEMTADFVPDMGRCRACYRRALIRNGIGDDGKRIAAYVRFFNDVGASNQDLYQLMIVHGALVKWQDMDTMQIHVKEDSWKIVHNAEGNSLYHNNYIYLEDYSRYFKEGYHKQNVFGDYTFHNMLNVILRYSWRDHIEKIKEEKEQAREISVEDTTANTMIEDANNKSEIRIAENVTNYYMLKKFSFLYHYFVFLDRNEYLADQIFIRHKIKVHFGKEYVRPDSDYIVVFCKVRKRHTDEFCKSMQELKNTMMLMEQGDYFDMCNKLYEMIEISNGAAKTEKKRKN